MKFNSNASFEQNKKKSRKICKAMKTLKNDRSTGMDNIDTEVIKQGRHELKRKVHHINTKDLETRNTAKGVGGRIIVPIHNKSG